MSALTQEKKEAIEAMGEYLDKLIPGLETVAGELKGDRKQDTDDFLKQCIDGLNWVIEIYNRVSDVLGGEGEKIEKEEINPIITDLGDGLREKEDQKTAEALEGVIPFLKKLKIMTQAGSEEKE